MDANTVAPIVIIALGTLLPALAGWLRASNQETRSLLRQARANVDEWETWATESRRNRRLHNDEWHPDGVGCIDIPDLPKYMTMETADD